MSELSAAISVGADIEVSVGAVAHGGHCVARYEGQVVFVRHALPGERVVARVTEIGSGGRFLRADAVQVVEASADRVAAPCVHAGAGRCGGCDWQHASLPAQRALKAAVLAEQLRRLAGIDREVVVEPVYGDHDGLKWRTRVSYSVDDEGRVGLHRHRSHHLELIESCPLATEAVDSIGVAARRWVGAESVTAVGSSSGDRAVVVRPLAAARQARVTESLPRDIAVVGVRGSARVAEVAAGREWKVPADGFWQVHPGAADALVAAVREGVLPKAGEHVVDLYAGAGLFGGSLAHDLGPGGRVDCVESDAASCSAARRSLHDMATVRVHEGDVGRWLATSAPKRCDVVVLDPPRSGAGKHVLERSVRMRPRALCYVACDPAALARDVAVLAGLGWQLDSLRAFDLFPMTHHLECVAVFTPTATR